MKDSERILTVLVCLIMLYGIFNYKHKFNKAEAVETQLLQANRVLAKKVLQQEQKIKVLKGNLP